MFWRRTLSGLAIAWFLMSAMFAVMIAPASASGGTPHDSILIGSNADFTSANGVTSGSGISSDPYIIEGWDLNASLGGYISISSTDAFFEIRNVSCASISLSSVQNGKIVSSNISTTTTAVDIYYCDFVEISGCNITAEPGLMTTGISIWLSNFVSVSYCNVSDCFWGIHTGNSLVLTLQNNVVRNCTQDGIYIDTCDSATVVNNHVSGTPTGITIGWSSDPIVIGNHVEKCNLSGMDIISVLRATVSANYFWNNPSGLVIAGSLNCLVSNNVFVSDGIVIGGSSIEHFTTHTIGLDNSVNGKPVRYYKDQTGLIVDGISSGEVILANCSGAHVTNLDLNDTAAGVQVAFTIGAVIDHTNITGSTVGIRTDYSSALIIENDNVTTSTFGVALYHSSNVTVNRTTLTAQGDLAIGVYLYYSIDVRMHQNNFTGEGVYISGNSVNFDTHNITLDNLVNGKPLYYIKNAAGQVIDGVPVGQIIIASSASTEIRNVDITSSASLGILIASSAVVSIDNVNVSNQIEGIEGVAGSDLMVSNSTFFNNSQMGVVLLDFMGGSMLGNRFTGNGIGLFFSDSVYFQVAHNGFVNNTEQARQWLNPSIPGDNQWYMEYPKGGNYWSDYAGVDELRGAAQDQPGSDGLGDTLYSFGVGYDLYPLKQPYGGNLHPIASFDAPAYANSTMNVFVNASTCLDAEDQIASLEVRWDWENDGTWDTSWSTAKTETHTYPGEGVYTIMLEVLDTGGLSDSTTRSVTVDAQAPITDIGMSGEVGANGWYYSDVEVWLNATDAMTAVASTVYQLDGQGWNDYYGSFYVTGGNHTLEYYSIDVAGNIEALATVHVKVDTSGPTTSITVDGALGANLWFASAVNVTLNATDDSQEINRTEWRLDGGSWTDYTGLFEISADGVHVLEFYSQDMSGRTESVKNESLKIDRTPPTTVASLVGGTSIDGWYGQAVDVYLTTQDSGSGVNHTWYSLDGISWQVYGGAFLVWGDGNHTVYYNSSDNVGKVEQVGSVVVRIDTSPPGMLVSTVGEMTSIGSAENWVISPVDVTIDASDTLSGVGWIRYRIDGGDWQNYMGEPFTIASNGNHTLEYQAADRIGNLGEIGTQTIKIDRTGPTVTMGGQNLSDTVRSKDITISIGAVDNMSGIYNVTAKLDGNNLTVGSTGSVEMKNLTEGEHTLVVIAIDGAGNGVMKTIEFTVNTHVVHWGYIAVFGAVLVFAGLIIWSFRPRVKTPPKTVGP